MYAPVTTAYSGSTSAASCTCNSLPATLARTPVDHCTMLVVSSGTGGIAKVEKYDCGSPYCQTSARYAATQAWMGALDARMGALKL